VSNGRNCAVDLVFNDIEPESGVISVRFVGPPGGEAVCQALEVGPGDGGPGAKPVQLLTVATTRAGNGPPARVPAADGNLLLNPGFEDGAPGEVGSLGRKAGGQGWTYLFAGASQAYIWPESDYSAHPDWGLPAFHAGQQALRTHGDGQGHTLIFQDTAVQPQTPYTASVWVRAVDLRGKGFGTDASDSAALQVQELDAAGKVVVQHPKQVVTRPGEYVRLAIPFTTSTATARVRFILDTLIACHYTEGHVTYDDCFLGGAAPSSTSAPAAGH
jgi:hypothetical protein